MKLPADKIISLKKEDSTTVLVNSQLPSQSNHPSPPAPSLASSTHPVETPTQSSNSSKPQSSNPNPLSSTYQSQLQSQLSSQFKQTSQFLSNAASKSGLPNENLQSQIDHVQPQTDTNPKPEEQDFGKKNEFEPKISQKIENKQSTIKVIY
jgi:hypothetical protein